MKAMAWLGMWCGLAGATVCGGEVWNAFPATTHAVIHVNAARVKALPALQGRLDSPVGKYRTIREQIATFTGVDLDSVTDIWIGAAPKDRGVIVLQGTYDKTMIENTLWSLGETLRTADVPGALVAVHLPDEKNPGQTNLGVLANANTLVVGNPELTRETVARLANGTPHPRAKEMTGFAADPALARVVLLDMERKPGDVGHELVRQNLQSMEFSVMQNGGSLAGTLRLIPKKPDLAPALNGLVESLLQLSVQAEGTHRLIPGTVRRLLSAATVRQDRGVVLVETQAPEKLVNEFVAQHLGGAL